MIAKIIVTGATRAEALQQLDAALAATAIDGTETNLRYLRAVASSPEFLAGTVTTSFLASFTAPRSAIEILEGGTQTTLQDYPGRVGFWNVGVPPSGPMDHLSFRIANRLVGNAADAAAIEFATMGGRLRFTADTLIALTGADMPAKLNGAPVPRWTAIEAKAGSILSLGAVADAGVRAYLAVRGAFDTQPYLGSRATFMLGGFGGPAGRALRSGDVLHLGQPGLALETPDTLPAELIPELAQHWQIGVLFGPHTAPDFFTEADIAMLFSTDWKVHYQSDRTGVRLTGPKPEWARPDGGEAGLHPSNIHDNAYAIGAIDFTGDMPILLGPDGPSLGGFVCPAVIVQAELWKLGQLKAGDLVRFHRVTNAEAEALEQAQDCFPRSVHRPPRPTPRGLAARTRYPPRPHRPHSRHDLPRRRRQVPPRRVRPHDPRPHPPLPRPRPRAAPPRPRAPRHPRHHPRRPLPALHFDSRVLPRATLIETLRDLDRTLPPLEDIAVPSRIVHLPLSWDDPQARLAQQKYMQAVRPDAPWCPSNIEFIRRINGLASIDDVYRIVHEASYLVLGLGDVYLGAPVATPIDPRHRLVTTKYNPARTWTPENAVGIGGAYLCVYGMEGPGGYQLVGRTIQVWNPWKSTPAFPPGKPWSLRFFDQLRFHDVSAEELLDARSRFPHGQYDLRVEETTFRLADYLRFLDSIADEAAAFKHHQAQAFNAERERWIAAGQMRLVEPPEAPADETAATVATVATGCEPVSSPMTASLFQIAVQPGQAVAEGDKLIVLDAMKTEIVVPSPFAGTVEAIHSTLGALVTSGQLLVSIRPS